MTAKRILRALTLAGCAALVGASITSCGPTEVKRKRKTDTPTPTVTPTATYPYAPVVLDSFESAPESVRERNPDRERRELLGHLKGWRPPFSFRTDELAQVERSRQQFFAPTIVPEAGDRPLSELALCPPASERQDATPVFPIHCDHSARIYFSVPPDYLPETRRKGPPPPALLAVGTPGSPAPLARREAEQGAHLGFPSPTPRPTAPWLVGVMYPDPSGSHELSLPNGTPVHDLRPYHQLAFDLLNPDAERFSFWVRVHDGRNHFADFPQSVSGTSVSKIRIPVEALRLAEARVDGQRRENARLDLRDIRFLSLVTDTSALAKDRAVFVDALRLENLAPTASPTPSASPFSFRRDVLGIGKPTPTRTPLPEGEEPPEEETPEEELEEEGAEETPAP